MPPLSVLIPTHKRPELLKRTLEFLATCNIPSSYAGLHVAENGGRFGAEDVVRSTPISLKANYYFYPKGNKSAALNECLRPLNGHILFLDDDVRVEPNFLVEYATACDATPPGTYFGGPLGIDYESPPPDWLLPYLPFSAVGWSPKERDHELGELRFLGANWCAHSDDIKSYGGFSEWCGPRIDQSGGQEAHMQKLFREAGLKPKYLPGAKVWHYVPRENCSPAWAVARIRRHAMYRGRFHQDASTRLFGIPRWMYRDLCHRWLSYFWKGLLHSSPETLFHARYEISERLGFMRGMRDAYLEKRRFTSNSSVS